ncbi:hypothetical protein OSB04_019670 [Centaurea solstitialis]|uniref:Uncharacterized protein n=1 Tax=Centaurea solstitialis TaxID=347529 RepID=A0AA38W584_9ASTR|nr:hypothetical protein OSB04_019670 [Centaurea solstitialis]
MLDPHLGCEEVEAQNFRIGIIVPFPESDYTSFPNQKTLFSELGDRFPESGSCSSDFHLVHFPNRALSFPESGNSVIRVGNSHFLTQNFRIGIIVPFPESDYTSFPNQKTLFSELGDRFPESGSCSSDFHLVHFPNRALSFPESGNSVIRVGNSHFLSRTSCAKSESENTIFRVGFRLFEPGNFQFSSQIRHLAIFSKIQTTSSYLCLKALEETAFFKSFLLNQVIYSKKILFIRDQDVERIIGIGSETRPLVLVMGEYQQWKRRMIHFLDLLDANLMKSIREGPIRPTVTVAAVPRTDTCPVLPAYVVEKPVDILVVEKSKYEVNVMFLKNLTPEWQNMAINIQLSRNLGAMGLHDLFSMMVQHEEFITGGRSKRGIDPLALATVPFGGPNSAPTQPTSFNNMPLPHHPEDFNHEFN